MTDKPTAGHPVGSQVVVTFARPGRDVAAVGDVVTVTTEPFVWKSGGYAMGRTMDGDADGDGVVVQAISLRWGNNIIAHPVAWLSPLADPDALVVSEPVAEAL